MAETPLNPRHEAFAREYIVDKNATAAAERAGYRGTRQGLAVTGSRLLKNPKIAARVESLLKDAGEAAGVSAKRIISELASVAFSDISKAFGPDGQLLPFKDMPPEARAALAGVETEELFEGKGEERAPAGVSRKVRHWDKVKALELLGKHMGLFKEKVEMTGEGGGPLTVELVRYDGKGGGA